MVKQRILLTIQQISDKYNISKSRLYKATHTQEIPFFKPSGGRVYIDESDFIAWITKNRIPSRTEIEAQSAIPA